MAEYIERAALLEITEQQGHVDVDDILGIPAADVAPVRHGRWQEKSWWQKGNRYTMSECSTCGGWVKPKSKFRYCPHCGARMDEEAEHGTTD